MGDVDRALHRIGHGDGYVLHIICCSVTVGVLVGEKVWRFLPLIGSLNTPVTEQDAIPECHNQGKKADGKKREKQGKNITWHISQERARVFLGGFLVTSRRA